MERLPHEILLEIFEFSPESFCSIERCSSKMYEISENSGFCKTITNTATALENTKFLTIIPTSLDTISRFNLPNTLKSIRIKTNEKWTFQKLGDITALNIKLIIAPFNGHESIYICKLIRVH